LEGKIYAGCLAARGGLGKFLIGVLKPRIRGAMIQVGVCLTRGRMTKLGTEEDNPWWRGEGVERRAWRVFGTERSGEISLWRMLRGTPIIFKENEGSAGNGRKDER